MQVELAQLRYRLPRLRGRGHAAEPAGRAASAPAVPARRSSRSTAGACCAACRSSSATSIGSAATRATQRKARRAARRPARRARRLHERGQVDAAQPAHARGRARRGPAVLDARPDRAPAAPARRRDRAALRHGRLRAPPAAPARRGVPVDARRGRRRRPAAAPRRRERTRRRGADRTRSTRCSARSTPATCPRCSCGTRPTSPTPTTSKILLAAHPGSVAISAATGDGHRRAAHARSATGCGRSARIIEFVVPYDRGDVLAALHRAGEVLVEVHGDRGTRVRARLPKRPPVASPSSRAARPISARCAMVGRPARIRPAAVPVRPARRARSGSPTRCRAASSTARSARRAIRCPRSRAAAAADALAASNGYPPSAGSAPALRDAAAALDRPPLRRRGRARARRSRASAPRSSSPRCRTCSRLRNPRRDTVLYPAVAYPSYEMGAIARRLPGGARSRSTRSGTSTSTRSATPTPSARSCSGSTSPATRRRRSRRRRTSRESPAWARERGIVVASDECYAEFAPEPATILAARARRRARDAQRCRSARTSRACGSASTPATPISSRTSSRRASTRG